MSSQCGRDVEEGEDKEAISSLSFIIEVEGQDKKKERKISHDLMQDIENSHRLT